jgi:ABC-2 type transport system ATP-binding protein/lipopolysaccharide transport system ATP-binding protein
VLRPVEDFVFGLAWHRADGTQVAGHNTELDGFKPLRLESDGEVSCVYDALELSPGEYLVDAAVHARDGLAYDYWRDALRVRITAAVEWPGVWAPRHTWESCGPAWDPE